MMWGCMRTEVTVYRFINSNEMVVYCSLTTEPGIPRGRLTEHATWMIQRFICSLQAGSRALTIEWWIKMLQIAVRNDLSPEMQRTDLESVFTSCESQQSGRPKVNGAKSDCQKWRLNRKSFLMLDLKRGKFWWTHAQREIDFKLSGDLCWRFAGASQLFKRLALGKVPERWSVFWRLCNRLQRSSWRTLRKPA